MISPFFNVHNIFLIVTSSKIAHYMIALFARADAVEREVAAATKRAEALTQAVLGKAFSGRL